MHDSWIHTPQKISPPRGTDINCLSSFRIQRTPSTLPLLNPDRYLKTPGDVTGERALVWLCVCQTCSFGFFLSLFRGSCSLETSSSGRSSFRYSICVPPSAFFRSLCRFLFLLCFSSRDFTCERVTVTSHHSFETSDLIDSGAFNPHRHPKCPIVPFAIDVIQIRHRIVQHNITDAAVIPSLNTKPMRCHISRTDCLC